MAARNRNILPFLLLIRSRLIAAGLPSQVEIRHGGKAEYILNANIEKDGIWVSTDQLRPLLARYDKEAMVARLKVGERNYRSQFIGNYDRIVTENRVPLIAAAMAVHGPLTSPTSTTHAYNVNVVYHLEKRLLNTLLGEPWAQRIGKGGSAYISILKATEAAVDSGLVAVGSQESLPESEAEDDEELYDDPTDTESNLAVDIAPIDLAETRQRLIAERQAREVNDSALIRNAIRSLQSSNILPYTLIFEGVPGTGKTHALSALRRSIHCEHAEAAKYFRGDGSGRFAMTMHPATSYEDFVEGLRPAATRVDPTQTGNNPLFVERPMVKDRDHMTGNWFFLKSGDQKLPDLAHDSAKIEYQSGQNSSSFVVQNGFFVAVCMEAVQHPTCSFVVLLDELNRCNIPKVMGELLTTVERSKRARWIPEIGKEGALPPMGHWDVSKAQVVSLPYSQRLFFVPENIYLIGTMNTTDRSVAPMDAALRRRFAFERIWPLGFEPTEPKTIETLLEILTSDLPAPSVSRRLLQPSVDLWFAINQKISQHGADVLLGHSYLFDLAHDLTNETTSGRPDQLDRIICHHWDKHLFPQLVDVILSNDLIDSIFPSSKNGSKEGDGLENLGIPPKGPYTVRWSLKGRGMMRVPTLHLVVTPTNPTSDSN